jgi:mRNA-degrading endonuclease RelE of RelBE toxin-antitoxin system
MLKEIKRLPEFSRDLKKLLKKYRTLEEDIRVFEETALKLYHVHKFEFDGIVQISHLGIEYPKIYKARKFACKSLKGKGAQSGIRIIYAYFPDENRIEYVEIYCKNVSENEDKRRILRYYNKSVSCEQGD